MDQYRIDLSCFASFMCVNTTVHTVPIYTKQLLGTCKLVNGFVNKIPCPGVHPVRRAPYMVGTIELQISLNAAF